MRSAFDSGFSDCFWVKNGGDLATPELGFYGNCGFRNAVSGC